MLQRYVCGALEAEVAVRTRVVAQSGGAVAERGAARAQLACRVRPQRARAVHLHRHGPRAALQRQLHNAHLIPLYHLFTSSFILI